MQGSLVVTDSKDGTERERAWERFQASIASHSAAIEALRLVQAMPDRAEFLAAQFQMRLRADPKYTADSLAEVSDRILENIDTEANGGFAVMRQSALVGSCASFEYLVKAFFVDGALAAPALAAEKLSTLRIRLDAAEVLGLEQVEQWFAIADRLMEDVGKAHPTMSARIQRFLLDHTHLPNGELHRKEIRQTFDELDNRCFNEAFLVRNCVVHNGGRTDSRLARLTLR